LQVNVKLHGILRDYLPRKAKGQTSLELPEGTTIEDVVNQLNIKQNVSASVDGAEVENSRVMQDGQELHLFRHIAGG